MATMNFSIPDDVKEAFNATFQGENKSAIVAALMRKAVEEKRRRTASDSLLDQMRKLHAAGPTFTDDQIRKARKDVRP